MGKVVSNEILNKMPIALAGMINPLGYRMLDHIARRCSNYPKVYIPVDHFQEGAEGWSLPLLRFNGKPVHRNTIKQTRKDLIASETIHYERDGVAGVYSIDPWLAKLVLIQYESKTTSDLFHSILPSFIHFDDACKDKERSLLKSLSSDPKLCVYITALSKNAAYIHTLLLSIGQLAGSTMLSNVGPVLVNLTQGAVGKSSVYRSLQQLSDLGLIQMSAKTNRDKGLCYIHKRPWGTPHPIIQETPL